MYCIHILYLPLAYILILRKILRSNIKTYTVSFNIYYIYTKCQKKLLFTSTDFIKFLFIEHSAFKFRSFLLKITISVEIYLQLFK
jgi:hypothetical protein